MAHLDFTTVIGSAAIAETFQFLYESFRDGAGAFSLVDDGGTKAVSVAGAAPVGADPAEGDWANNGYFVVEAPHANGGVGQVQFRFNLTAEDIDLRTSFRGGWQNVDEFVGGGGLL